jgi:hypothetical protein
MAGAFSDSRAVERQTRKNKSQKVGAFFKSEKVAATTPRLPRKTPHHHHQKTTSRTRLLPKTPAKKPIPHEFKKSRNNLPIRVICLF